MFLVTNFYHLLEVDMASEENAQARTYTQRHMNNPWSEMISCSPCFAFYYFSSLSWFIQTTWDISYPSHTNVMALFLPYCFSCLFHYVYIDYEQFNAPPSTPSWVYVILSMTQIYVAQ